MSDLHEHNDASIPLLSDVLVPGNAMGAPRGTAAAQSEAASPEYEAASPEHEAALPEHEAASPDHPHAAAVPCLSEQDADALVERLEGRCLSWLTGDGRRVIEARCNTALLEHTHWVVGQVAREIGLALESELKSWVREAVREELEARGNPAPDNPPI